MTDGDEIVAGDRARLAMDVVGDALKDIEGAIFEQLRALNIHDDASKNELLRSLKNLDRVRGLIQVRIERGMVAREKLKLTPFDRIRERIGI